MNSDTNDIVKRFHDSVNMSPTQLEKWLQSEKSHAVGAKKNGGESVGHASGRRIVRLLHKPQADLTEGDLKHMKKVAGYVARHLAQRPAGNVRDTPWRYSLMNWGHDPSKK